MTAISTNGMVRNGQNLKEANENKFFNMDKQKLEKELGYRLSSNLVLHAAEMEKIEVDSWVGQTPSCRIPIEVVP